MKTHLFTSESVSEGHPDKVSDQVSDAVLDQYLMRDPNSKVACETFCTTGLVVVGGEITSSAVDVNVEQTVRDTIERIGYTKPQHRFDALSCGVLNAMHGQSPDINQGVVEGKGLHKEQGAGDQGMMFGYACSDTENYMPITLELSNMILEEMAAIRKEGKEMTYLGPDSKAQVTVEYNSRRKPLKVHTIVVSTQHDEFVLPAKNTEKAKAEAEKKMLDQIKKDVMEKVIKRVIKKLPTMKLRRLFGRGWRDRIILHVNPTGKFVVGGPHGDVGLTGRKIIVDTYGGKGAHGGGAFSGKDSSKVDRSAAYAARHIAKNLVAAGLCTEALVQVAYAIGVAQPISINVNTFGTSHTWFHGEKLKDHTIGEWVAENWDMRPAAIVKRFGLKDPIFSETAAYGHFGRKSEEKEVEVMYWDAKDKSLTKKKNKDGSTTITKKVNTFGWERLDRVQDVISHFDILNPPVVEEVL